MNELVDADSGILVSPEASYARARGQGFRIAKAALAAAIEQVLASSLERRRQLGSAARKRFNEKQIIFNHNINEAFSSVF